MLRKIYFSGSFLGLIFTTRPNQSALSIDGNCFETTSRHAIAGQKEVNDDLRLGQPSTSQADERIGSQSVKNRLSTGMF